MKKEALGDTPYDRLKALMVALRRDCPWDSEQSFKTIASYTIEEAYEVDEAIKAHDMDALKTELGDLLFQIVFHSIMAEEIGAFDMDAVTDGLVQKMIDRHPHVFSTKDSERSANAQKIAWEDIKAAERAQKGAAKNGLLDDVALALPALMRAEKLQKRAARIGFDWPDIDQVVDKIAEEAGEVAEAAKTSDPDNIEDEIGDLIFAVTNLARKLKVDPEKALRRTNDKFIRRFAYIEAKADKPLANMTLDEMETLWQTAKMGEASKVSKP